MKLQVDAETRWEKNVPRGFVQEALAAFQKGLVQTQETC